MSKQGWVGSGETEWTAAYGQLKKEVIEKRQREGPSPASEVQKLLSAVEKLEDDLVIMRTAAMEYELSASEIARRELILQNMKNQVGAIRVISNTTGDVTSQKTKYDGPKKWFRKEHEDVINPITAGNQELLQRQEDIIKLQDDALMDISKGIDRLHEQAVIIGEEAKTHVEIIKHIEGNVDEVTDKLRDEAKHANEITQSSQMLWMYLTAGFEIILILIIGIVLLSRE